MSTSDVKRRDERAVQLKRFEEAMEWPMLFLALLMIPLLGMPLALDVNDSTNVAIESVSFLIWALFAAELSIRTYLAEHRLRYLLKYWYDVAIVVVGFPLIAGGIARSARIARLLRLLRLLPFVALIWASTRSMMRHRGLQWIVLAGIAIVFAGAAGVWVLEDGQDGGLDNYGTTLWWAMETVTTVGYGDHVPVTPEGRGVAVFLMLVGIAFFSWVTANIAAFLVEFGGGDAGGVTTHDLMAKLEELESEIKALRAERPAGDGAGQDTALDEVGGQEPAGD